MVTIQELLDDGAGIELTMLGGAVPSEDVVRVVIAETLEEVGEATGKVLVVVTPGALQGREPYEFDIAIRKGAAQGIAAVLLMGQEQTLPTAARIAERSGIAILTAPRGASIADTVLGIDRRLRSDLGDQVDRALQTIDRLRSRSEARALEVLLAEASSAMGVRIGLTDEVDGEPVIVNGETRYRLVADRITLAAQLSLPVVAAAAARWQERRDAEDQAPEQVRAEALTDLVLRESSAIALGAADRLRATGLIPEATHVG
ncbi:hypothetical protein, partial [Microbacterium sp. 13-71-7]|uniref:hypothetical protein n=1 Tax=Microbacterium sp. 13-71-7 TaxID=1970399 RepID=UPI000BC7F6CB